MTNPVRLRPGDKVRVTITISHHFDPPVGTKGTVAECSLCSQDDQKYPYVLWDGWHKEFKSYGHTEDKNGWHMCRNEIRKIGIFRELEV